MVSVLTTGSSGSVTLAPIVQNYRGSAAQPPMDYEGFEMNSASQVVFGNGNQCVLQAITVNSAGSNPPLLQVWQITASGGSFGRATVNHGSTSGNTLWYNMSCPKGFIINWISGIGDITVTYRETALGE